MRKQNQLNSVLKVISLYVFLFAFLMLPIGCNKTSTPESTNFKPQDIVEPQEIAETQEAAEPREAEVTSEPEMIEQASPESYGNWNIQFNISNQSFAVSPVDIKVYIDGKLAVNEEFEVGNQHNNKTFYFKLTEGQHQLRVESVKGNATLEQSFEISGKRYAGILYGGFPMGRGAVGGIRGRFQFIIQDTRLLMA